MALINVGPTRQTNHAGIIGDLESRLWAGHPYRDRDVMTWAHEATHGVNSGIRNRAHKNGIKVNASYFLAGQTFLLEEPDSTIRAMAEQVPQRFRDSTYDLYMVKMQKYWNDRPLYVFDELAAYLNGTRMGVKAKIYDKDQVRFISSLVNGTKFLAYGSSLMRDHGTPELSQAYAYYRIQYADLCHQYDATTKYIDFSKEVY